MGVKNVKQEIADMKLTIQQRGEQLKLWNSAKDNCYNSKYLVVKLLLGDKSDLQAFGRLVQAANRGSSLSPEQQQALQQLASTHEKTIMQAVAINRKIDLKWYKAREKPNTEV